MGCSQLSNNKTYDFFLKTSNRKTRDSTQTSGVGENGTFKVTGDILQIKDTLSVTSLSAINFIESVQK